MKQNIPLDAERKKDFHGGNKRGADSVVDRSMTNRILFQALAIKQYMAYGKV